MGNMGSKEKQKAGNYFKGLMKKAQEAINLVIGNSEVYSEEDTAGDLRFDPAVMMKINVTFDKEFLPYNGKRKKSTPRTKKGQSIFSPLNALPLQYTLYNYCAGHLISFTRLLLGG